MVPVVVRVQSFRRETGDTFTLGLAPPAGTQRPYAFLPGQFNMLYAFGVGEVPISMSGDPDDAARFIAHTIRGVGPVTNALGRIRPGDAVGMRGPFGSCWPLETAQGGDVVLVSGGIGLAPLRPTVYHLLRHRERFRRVVLLQGVRSPSDILFADELAAWSSRHDFQVILSVDRADESWHGNVGVITKFFPQAVFDPRQVVAFLCGPELMMRAALSGLENRGVAEDCIFLSLERNMQCAVGFCGHCQFGTQFVCMDGPVFRYDRIQRFFNVREA
jgi:NAD(P)H-flavin reductase